ncbi:MAG: UbiA family prenyltransferase [Planctomycetia bacterium]|nr:UbiA family prenyltransferase [Planctomycetia bacterium]
MGVTTEPQGAEPLLRNGLSGLHVCHPNLKRPGRAAHRPPWKRAGPVFVDLDGTLIRTDALWESLLRAVKSDARVLCKLPYWLSKGRASFKRSLTEAAMPDAHTMPFREDVVAFLRQEKKQGRALVLATAADRRIANVIARELGLFDDVLSSDGETNLKGHAKLAAIDAWCAANECSSFSYVGDSKADLPIWRRASGVHVVAPGRRLTRALSTFCTATHTFGDERRRWRAVLRAVRPHQWLKNLLVFVPIVCAHGFTLLGSILAAVLAFIAFSFCASAVYVLNDLLDIDADRRHPEKRKRPFAAGALPLAWGPPLAVGLLAAAFGMSFALLPGPFVATLALYVAVTSLYTFWLKKTLIVDVLTLAGLYALRVMAGAYAAHIDVSQWLMAFSMFLFLSLAFAKRHSELRRLEGEGGESTPRGRAYSVEDVRLIESIGPTSGYLAVLVFALYINSDAMKAVYADATALWLICPLLLYWVSRVWFFSARGQLPEDPVVFAAHDRVSLGTFAVAAVLLVIATIA